MEGACLLACSPYFAQLLFIYIKPTYPGVSLPTVARITFTSVINQENIPASLLRGQSDGGFFSVEDLCWGRL